MEIIIRKLETQFNRVANCATHQRGISYKREDAPFRTIAQRWIFLTASYHDITSTSSLTNSFLVINLRSLDLRIFPKFKIPQSTTTYPPTISSGSHPPPRLDERKLYYFIKSQNPFDHPNHPTDLFVRQSQLS
ncbi:hypothetical protein DID88_001505 [Monilinia fructigena]|uniref:Uncharacterized protein n=1 Tax=Monilinia fructigena TaxID=38457 RepID=A0A395IZP7_9HELO|nr:hypothetical protein DID88_001505 [Monilinia fructigena]